MRCGPGMPISDASEDQPRSQPGNAETDAAARPDGSRESDAPLPVIHGLTPPGVPPIGNIGAEFRVAEPDLSAAVAMPAAPAAPTPPEPAPSIPPMPPPAESSEPGSGRLSAGRIFGGYELLAKIGQGGMGEVYKARQVSLDRVVAIKILARALYDNEEFIKRFEREAKAIARITHPNIVGVYDFGHHDGLRYMVNEFVDGKSLAKLISDRLVLPAAEFVPLMVQCLSGLNHVGSQGIVHRDIKPDNILITRDNIAKIADFGLAKDVSRKDDNTDLTAAGLAMGTPAYMSPEQCMGQKLDVRSDIYAFGVTAYFALTGQKPFTGNSSFEVMTKQREHHPPPPHKLAPGVPAELSSVVMRMLAKQPDERYPDAEACRRAWVEVGVQLGVFGSADLEARLRPSTELPALVPLPKAPQPAAEAPLPLPPAAAAAAGPPVEVVVPAAPPRPSAPARVATESVRTSAERTASERAQRRPVVDTASCAKCGHINRAEAAICGRCGNPLRDREDAASLLQQESEAQRLFEARRFADAAVIWARLADREQDKRARSVLRSKEREARKHEHEARIADLRARAQGQTARGDLRGALATLEQGRDLHRDSAASTTSSSVSDVQLERDIMALRQRLANRRRFMQIGIAVAIAAAAVLALIAVRQGWLGRAAAPPAQPAQPTQPEPTP
jgi:tRNA A-37 threonylcarbamoyl transferase component Bud32